jgi:hypothetical protein
VLVWAWWVSPVGLVGGWPAAGSRTRGARGLDRWPASDLRRVGIRQKGATRAPVVPVRSDLASRQQACRGL